VARENPRHFATSLPTEEHVERALSSRRRDPNDDDVTRASRGVIAAADIPTFVVVAVLFSAALHATWNALLKSTDDAFLRFALIDATGFVFSLAAVAFVPAPYGCWRYLGASAVIHVGYKAFLMWAYRSGDLSFAYPIARGSAPLLVAIGGALFVHEPLGALGVAGVVLVSFGVSGIAFRRGASATHHVALAAALLTAATIAAYTIADGLGVRCAPTPFGYAVWLFLLDGIAFPMWAVLTRRAGELIRPDPKVLVGVVAGMLTITAYGIILWAQTKAPLAFVAALRETSVLFAAAIGVMILHERADRTRLVSAAVVVGGVVLLRLS
jgi:drug/metabolite transporter (DMT)-like permease